MNWDLYFRVVTQIGGRYLLIAGVAFLLFYYLLSRRVRGRKIQSKMPRNRDITREISFSLLTIVIAGFIVVALHHPAVAPYTTRYRNISDHGWLYYFLLFPVMFVMHDTYFYFTHRLMHHPRIFRIFHLVHHKSTNPSPWAAYAFHPFEALVEQFITVIFYFTIPIHITHLGIFFLLSIIYNVYGHLGYELYPKGFSKTAVGKWINTSTSHNQHHHYFKGNYGLYFLFWDRILGTVRQDYDEQFDALKSTAAEQPEELALQAG